jgi:hypothetical protein
LSKALRLPTMEVAGMTLIKRLALVIDDAILTKVSIPSFHRTGTRATCSPGSNRTPDAERPSRRQGERGKGGYWGPAFFAGRLCGR